MARTSCNLPIGWAAALTFSVDAMAAMLRVSLLIADACEVGKPLVTAKPRLSSFFLDSYLSAGKCVRGQRGSARQKSMSCPDYRLRIIGTTVFGQHVTARFFKAIFFEEGIASQSRPLMTQSEHRPAPLEVGRVVSWAAGGSMSNGAPTAPLFN
jgi:hypothetical protein